MKYYTQELHKSVQFYSYYFVSDIYLDMFILKKMYPYGEEFDLESAKQTIEECYESNVCNNFNEKILYFSELRKYLIDESSAMIPLSDYNFFKLRMYAIKCLDRLNEAENAIKEERLKIRNGEYPIGLKELARQSFRNYDVMFIKDVDGLIVQYYKDKKMPDYALKFVELENYADVVVDKRLSCIIYEEVFEEKGLFIYNVLFDNKFNNDGSIMELSLKFKDIKIIKDNTMEPSLTAPSISMIKPK